MSYYSYENQPGDSLLSLLSSAGFSHPRNAALPRNDHGYDAVQGRANDRTRGGREMHRPRDHDAEIHFGALAPLDLSLILDNAIGLMDEDDFASDFDHQGNRSTVEHNHSTNTARGEGRQRDNERRRNQ